MDAIVRGYVAVYGVDVMDLLVPSGSFDLSSVDKSIFRHPRAKSVHDHVCVPMGDLVECGQSNAHTCDLHVISRPFRMV